MRVLDLGGRPSFWWSLPEHPKEVVVLNVEELDPADQDWIRVVKGNACEPPSGLGTFDLVFSNSTIEHVGGHSDRKRFAATTRSMAPAYWVQTPYRYFPIEPHWIFPGFQFLPVAARVAVAKRWKPGLRNGMGASVDHVADVELLSVAEMAAYFPEATILRERFAGLTKSLIAVRS